MARERIRARRARGGNTNWRNPRAKTEESTAAKVRGRTSEGATVGQLNESEARDAKNKAEITTEKRGSVTSDDQGYRIDRDDSTSANPEETPNGKQGEECFEEQARAAEHKEANEPS